MLVVGQSWSVTVQKEFGLQGLQSVGLFFEKRPFYNNKEQNISNESSGVIDPIGFLSSSKLLNLVFYLKVYEWSLRTFPQFFPIWSICSLVSAKKECSFILFIWNLVSIAFLSLKLLFSCFDITWIQIFFVFRNLPVFHVF